MLLLYMLGITGNVSIDGNGDRIADYTILVVQFGKYVPLFDILAPQPLHVVPRLNDSEWRKILWPGDVLHAPGDTPTCGWNAELCRLRISTLHTAY